MRLTVWMRRCKTFSDNWKTDRSASGHLRGARHGAIKQEKTLCKSPNNNSKPKLGRTH